ncbi:hibch [Symbiodinium pilosum]|uniref:3-hydroxyisobutyryl-CoA hydrolase n=1 Tax=Symbiodinium pilosum TaxID=2952 RepID=A0A812Q3G7_SYMPI|nr:hibch [Symbiodinium pilosum]
MVKKALRTKRKDPDEQQSAKPAKEIRKRAWKPQGDYKGSKVRNVPFSDVENAKIVKAMQAYCDEEGFDYNTVSESLHKERTGGAWGRIAFLAGLDRRSTWAIVQRAKRILWGGHRWTHEECQILLDEASSAKRPSWVNISNILGVNPNTVRDKWRELCGGNKSTGNFTPAEDWRLRMAICHTTESLLPTKDIPWTKVQKWLPHRGYKMLGMQQQVQWWYEAGNVRLALAGPVHGHQCALEAGGGNNARPKMPMKASDKILMEVQGASMHSGTGYFTDDADFLDPEARICRAGPSQLRRWRHMDDPTLQAKVLERRSNVGMGMLVLNRAKGSEQLVSVDALKYVVENLGKGLQPAEGLDLPTVNELYKRLRNLEVNSLKRFVGLTAAEEFRDRAETDREDLGFHSELEGYREGPGSFGTGRFCIGLDPKEMLLAAVYAQKNGDLAPFSKALLWNSQELAFLVADYRKPLVCQLSGIARDGGAALAGLTTFSGAHATSEVSVRSCFHGLVPMGGMTALLGSLKWNLGEFLALTGWTLRGTDLVSLGLCQHWLSPDALPFLELTAEKQLEVSESDAAQLLLEHSLPLPEDSGLISGDPDAPGFQRSYIPLVAEIFSKDSPKQIMEALDKKLQLREPINSWKDMEFLKVCRERLDRVDPRAGTDFGCPGKRQCTGTSLVQRYAAESMVLAALTGRCSTWCFAEEPWNERFMEKPEDILKKEIEATEPPEELLRCWRYHPDYDAATGPVTSLDHDPVWMQQEVRRWDPQLFDLERRQAVEASSLGKGLEEADKLREEGNQLFKSGDFGTARQRYYGAIWHLDFDIGQQWANASCKESCKSFQQADSLIPGDRQLRSALKEASELQKQAPVLNKEGNPCKEDRQKAKEVWKSKLLSQEEKACQAMRCGPQVFKSACNSAENLIFLFEAVYFQLRDVLCPRFYLTEEGMFAPESSDVLLGYLAISTKARYVFSQFVTSIFLCFTLGMANPTDVRHFDTEVFPQMLQKEVSEKFVAVLVAVLAGILLCSGDFVMAKAIDVLGLAVACPTGFGLALTCGTGLSYAIEPKADPRLLFPGLGACMLGILCDAASHAEPKSAGSSRNDVSASKAESMGNTSAATVEEVKIATPQDASTDRNCSVFLLPVAGGLLCGSMAPINTAAATAGQLTPFSQLFSFMVGQLLAIFPLVTVFHWISLGQEGRMGHSVWQILCSLWSSYLKACKQRRKGLMWDAFAGTCVGMGYFLFLVGTPVVSKAVGFIFGSSSLLRFDRRSADFLRRQLRFRAP